MEDNYQGMKFNDTFRGDDPARFNACVGDNGSPSYREYADGFADAAIILIDNAIETLDVDDQIYPICFNMRHSVELRLKHQIERLKLIRPEISLNDFNSAGSHDIGIIWDYFKEKSQLFDSRFDKVVSEINGCVKDIAEVDPTGQTFRYPLSNESVKHLVNVAIINVVRLKDSFTILRERLDNLHYLTGILINEYQQGTYTKKLSREDIKTIAEHLPFKSEWRLDSFDDVRETVKEKYCIKNNELSDCINLIKAHREFSPMIGMEVSLIECDFDDLCVFFQCLEIINPLDDYLKSPRVVGFNEVSFDNMFNDLEAENENRLLTQMVCKEDIGLEALIGIFSLYEFGRHLNYSEYYEEIYKVELKSKALYEKHDRELDSIIDHYLNKTNAYECILKSLKFLSQCDMVASLDSMFDLKRYFDFVTD